MIRFMCRYKPVFLTGIFMFTTFSAEAENACPPLEYSKQALLEIRQAGFVIEDETQRNALAVALLGCVGDPDPELRDGVAFEGISTWLRAEQLSTATYLALYQGLLEQLEGPPDAAGFKQAFAALILSEVARVDRMQARLSYDQRNHLVQAAARYLSSVSDYRGFSETEGWRHGVAHGADLALQLVLNEAVTADQVKSLLASVAVQIAPTGDVFYIYGEPSRLARVAFYAHRRGLLDETFWQTWFDGVADPEPMAAWSEAFTSQSGLAKRHNTLGFLQVMHFNATSAEDEQGSELAEWVLSALRTVLN